MKVSFYPKLALSAINKNKRLYFPYILTGTLMVTMYYILSYLITSKALAMMPGGSVLMTLLPMGCMVIALFSVLFLFYTNSFLLKQHYREFGLYNMLGMDKKNICLVILCESLFTFLTAIITGLAVGIVFSKAAELILVNLLNMKVSFDLNIGFSSVIQTVLIFALIYFLIMLNSLIKVVKINPIELMRQNKAGEKLPKYSWVFGLAGVALLLEAYYLAVSIEEPVTALFVFFTAVIMVIIGTYLVFISGSVALCKALKKNKKYYYKPEHFVTVSSMAYRMKRNGAGLASICILLTMVLVMISTSASLYFGEEDSIFNRYPNNINIKVTYDNIEALKDENLDKLRDEISLCYGDDESIRGFRSCVIPGLFTDYGIMIDYNNIDNKTAISYENVGNLYVVSLDDYNNLMNETKTLNENECLIYTDSLSNTWDTFTVEYLSSLKVKENLTEYEKDSDTMIMTMPSVFMVVDDVYSFLEPITDMKNALGESMISYTYRCGLDTDTVKDEIQIKSDIYDVVRSHWEDGGMGVTSFYVNSREEEKDGFYELYGSLFFICIMLSIVFLFAAVLIIYYKQISEGYEDQKRFEIMQKVGMTKRDIRKSINSQVLTVFFMPLIMAGLHLTFAFPFISKIMLMFAFDNTLLNIIVTVCCFAVFGVLYAVVYKLTSSVYYLIVSEMNKNQLDM